MFFFYPCTKKIYIIIFIYFFFLLNLKGKAKTICKLLIQIVFNYFSFHLHAKQMNSNHYFVKLSKLFLLQIVNISLFLSHFKAISLSLTH